MAESFTRAVREELTGVGESRPCGRLAEMAALVRTTGTFHIRGGITDEERYGLHLATTIQAAARRVFTYFRSFGVEADLLTQREARLKRRLIYEVHLRGSPAMLQALNELGILSDSFRLVPGLPWRLLRRRCCKAAFVRGVLIGAGSVNPPWREAHLEIVSPLEDFAADLVELLTRLEFHAGVYSRRGSHVVYLKSREEVAELLALAGAQDAAIKIEEQAVVKDVRARANRLANCDEANLRRTGVAAARQLEAIDYLEERGLLARLPQALQQMARIRREHPYLSLSELADEVPEGLGRSALNHRLRRLTRAAEAAGWGPETAGPYGRIARPSGMSGAGTSTKRRGHG